MAQFEGDESTGLTLVKQPASANNVLKVRLPEEMTSTPTPLVSQFAGQISQTFDYEAS